ncbi:hypothetical protein KAFR_0D04080 [Kazachstania africana CBS 2517]|uniref:Multicopper oxidase n=1 Tax=Kazachstania africana (strain ATCC 22294 / BCRC 22015 / CBS 2517 / CECT 1963 / NBRC 1671 / NRRL Y-8276) TaxID=1071382 RepID=H2AUK6_KAZAF|nr:hypothetical protein KAFR_0D04080 [Kazachstania africana CBS 2517]CCF58056.1 hypothetical protein KAFR_0D04080 [Kazachstania africana CBS 2517]
MVGYLRRRNDFFLIGFLTTMFSFLVSSAFSRSELIEFEVTSTVSKFGRRIISINDHLEMYGPTITVSSGDTINLSVHNFICSADEVAEMENDIFLKEYCVTGLHFHGLVPIENKNDGIPFVTQPPIGPDETFWYNFTIPLGVCGTFWYHSHSTIQYGDGFRGAFIVKCKLFEDVSHQTMLSLESKNNISSGTLLELHPLYRKLSNSEILEHIITLSDYYNDWNLQIMRTKIMAKGRGTTDPSIDDSLINGSQEENIMTKIDKKVKFLILRVINTGMSGTQVLHMENHTMTVIETDGVIIKPYILDTLTIAVGQRYTIIIRLNERQEQYRLISGCNKMMGYITKNYYFTRKYHRGKSSNVGDKDIINIKELPNFSRNELLHEFIPLHNEMFKLDEKTIKSSLLKEPSKTTYLAYKYRLDPIILKKYGTGMYMVNDKTFDEYLNDPIKLAIDPETSHDIVINSIDHMRHPWHLHGHHFQLVSIGAGGEGSLNKDQKNSAAWEKYDSDINFWNDTKQTPTIRDSINIPGNSFAVLRILPQVQGCWVLHCHVEWHMMKGLGVMFNMTQTNTLDNANPMQTTSAINKNTFLTKLVAITVYTVSISSFLIMAYWRLVQQ